MEHPLIGDLDDLTMDQLEAKVNELTGKFFIAQRTGNGYLCDQIRMAIESYKAKLFEKREEQYKKATEKFDDKIDIT
jgi:hypothetical protein